MRILHVITGLETGGAENLVLEIARRQAALGHCTAVCAIYHKQGLKSRTVRDNVEIIHLGFTNKFNPCILIQLIQLFKQWQPEIVHTHLFHATLWARVAAKWSGIEALFTTEHNTSNWQQKYFLVNLFYRLTFGKAQKIFAISEAVKAAVIKYGKINPNKIDVLYNGIDLTKFQDVSILENPYEFSKPVIGSVGRLDSRKGYRYLLEASQAIFSKYPNATMLLIGDGEEKNNLKDFIQKNRLPVEQIQFLGQKEDVLPYLKMMDVFILPSIQEGFGIALLEAMAARIPVIGTNVGGIPEIIIPNETGVLVEAKNPKVISDAVSDILEHPEKAKTLVKNAKKLVNSKFDIDLLVQKLLHYYSNNLN